jgi:predicted Zn finger-like uncharacterized protein
MKVSCPSCSAGLNIDDKKIPAGGARIKCPTCQNVFPVKPPPASSASQTSSVPLPGSPSGAVALPGFAKVSSPSTTIPLPGAVQQSASSASSGSIPLPGSVTKASSGVIPLPGSSGSASIPLPGSVTKPPTSGIPLPGSAAKTIPAPINSIPLPGASSKFTSSSPSGSIPLPGSASKIPSSSASGSIPLPGSAMPPPIPRSAIPLPGAIKSSASTAIPLPGPALIPNIPGALSGVAPPSNVGVSSKSAIAAAKTLEESDWEDEPTRSFTLPIPALARGDEQTVSLPGKSAGEFSVPSLESIPLPGATGQRPENARAPLAFGSNQNDDLAQESSFGFQGSSEGDLALEVSEKTNINAHPADTGAAWDFSPDSNTENAEQTNFNPPSGDTFAAPANSFEFNLSSDSQTQSFDTVDSPPEPSGFDFAAPPPPASTGFDFAAPPPPASTGFDFAAPPPAASTGFDFAAPPPAASTGFDFAAPPPAASTGFDFAAPPPAASTGFDFAAPPPPASAGFDFAAPPPPASTGFDFAAPPPPASTGFDFAAPPPAASDGFDFAQPPPAATGFDFDSPPTPDPAPPPASLAFGDVDMPADNASQGAPDLATLSFIDDTTAPPQQTARRFQVKRKSGKVFGPFEEAVVVKMMEDGQLLGNEEVSTDGENWQPIGSEPAFQAVIAKSFDTDSKENAKVDAPAPSAPVKYPTNPNAPMGEVNPQSMDRMKQLYEGRMAAVAVVQSKDPIDFRKFIPAAIAGAVVLAIAVAGVVVGQTTPYGYFGLKAIFPNKVKPDTREFAYLQTARTAFATDTFESYKAAKDASLQALAINEFPEARAVWGQSILHLQRRFQKADPSDVAEVTESLNRIKLLGEKHPEVLKTLASEALSRKSYDEALGFAADAVARDENDMEAHFLRAEAYVAKKQPKQAQTDFEAVLKKEAKSARALHSLGLLFASQNDFDSAIAKFSGALAADPKHTASAVEAAEISLVKKQDAERALAFIETALSDEGKKGLGQNELAKALALKADLTAPKTTGTEAENAAGNLAMFEEALKADPNNTFAQGRAARAYLDAHMPEKALPLFQKASETVPDNLDFAQGHIEALIAVGKMDEALRMNARASARFAGNAKLALVGGKLNEALDKTKDAEEAYRRAIAADGTLADASVALARLHLKFRRFAEAKPVLEAGLEKNPQSAALHVGMGELLFQERDVVKAETEFKKAFELDPKLSEAHLGLSRVALENGQYQAAADHVATALQLNKFVEGGNLQKGMALWKLGKLDEAIEGLEAARKNDPRNNQLTVILGAVEFDKGDLPAAMNHLSLALATQPGHADANFYMGKLKNAKTEHTQAVEYFRKALDFNAKSPLYHFWMGKALYDQRKSDDALAEWKIAAELDPKYADPREWTGRVFFDRNNFPKALKEFSGVLEIDSSRSQVRVLMGDAAMKQDDWNNAIASYTKALEQDASRVDLYFKLGQANENNKNQPKAVEWYLKTIQGEPKNAEAWLAVAYIYKDQKRKNEAKSAFQKYLELTPGATNKKEIEDEIYFLTHE